MKLIKYILPMVAMGGFFTSCDDVEAYSPEEVNPPFTYSPLYYQNLRDYKASDHEIAFGWVADYAKRNSMATSFLGLPDSLDICSLWGGIPSDPEVFADMRFVQKTKGTKMVAVAITRIDSETSEKPFKQYYDEARANGNQDSIYRAFELYAEYFLDQVFENDLDGFDCDYEPEGDYLSGDNFRYFFMYMAKYLGPNPDQTKEERLELIRQRYGDAIANQPGVCDKMLNIDQTSTSLSDLAPYSNYCFLQAYGGGTGAGQWPDEKVVYCCNMGDNWNTPLNEMYNQARYKPASGKRKGGFGAFFLHRNYRTTETNLEPYYHFRRCIQIQNPAIY
ncbi:MAG: glycosyl hydrolase [Bacteroides sp.]|nr:glycosyl hydrolase [Bacteroides sp.]MDE6038713.1 glycosyl hydrolase [Paramuribaculum sp.]